MKRYSALAFALLGAVVALAATVSAASANRLAANEERFSAVWRIMTFTATGARIECPVTLEGTLHSRTITKTAGTLIGYITRAIVGERSCVGGTARADTETLPWHIKYNSFSGTLPTITSVSTTVSEPVFEIAASIFGAEVQCRMKGSINGIFNVGSRGVVTGVGVEGTASLERSIRGICPSSGTLSGTSNPPTTAGGASMVLTLV